ncbi:ribosome maturation factor RimM [Fusobacterium sp. PH5-44]|uniref:ribosome maturation factor RimM n=1 Tax=unclassified Fusobacterium TaxID=2648384 RepID=UPI003D1ED9E9
MELFVIGKIFGSHNLKGAVKFSSVIEGLDQLVGEKMVITTEKGEDKILTLKGVKNTVENKWIIDFAEIESKDEAAVLRNSIVKVRKDLIDIDEDFYTDEELVGMSVYEINNGSVSLGKVMDIFSTPAHDILVVEDDIHEILIPNIEFFVKSIDKDKNQIKVELLDGMKEVKKKKD